MSGHEIKKGIWSRSQKHGTPVQQSITQSTSAGASTSSQAWNGNGWPMPLPNDALPIETHSYPEVSDDDSTSVEDCSTCSESTSSMASLCSTCTDSGSCMSCTEEAIWDDHVDEKGNLFYVQKVPTKVSKSTCSQQSDEKLSEEKQVWVHLKKLQQKWTPADEDVLAEKVLGISLIEHESGHVEVSQILPAKKSLVKKGKVKIGDIVMAINSIPLTKRNLNHLLRDVMEAGQKKVKLSLMRVKPSLHAFNGGLPERVEHVEHLTEEVVKAFQDPKTEGRRHSSSVKTLFIAGEGNRTLYSLPKVIHDGDVDILSKIKGTFLTLPFVMKDIMGCYPDHILLDIPGDGKRELMDVFLHVEGRSVLCTSSCHVNILRREKLLEWMRCLLELFVWHFSSTTNALSSKEGQGVADNYLKMLSNQLDHSILNASPLSSSAHLPRFIFSDCPAVLPLEYDVKGLMITSHLPADLTRLVHMYLHWNGLLGLTTHHSVSQMAIWTSLQKPKLYLQVVGLGQSLLAVILENLVFTYEWEDGRGPEYIYIHEALKTLRDIQQLGLHLIWNSSLEKGLLACNQSKKKGTPSKRVSLIQRRKKSKESVYLFNANVLYLLTQDVDPEKEERRSLVSAVSAPSLDYPLSLSSRAHPPSHHHSTSSIERMWKATLREEGRVTGRREERLHRLQLSNYRGSSSSSLFGIGEKFVKSPSHHPPPVRLCRGSDSSFPNLIHFVHSQGQQGYVITPIQLSPDGEDESLIFQQFFLLSSCIRLQLVKAQSKNVEIGALFNIPGKKPSQTSSYWVIGRKGSDSRETYICYHDSVPQDVIEFVFNLESHV
ncbi:unnamed protein product [Darwinula stevensoni]|uniref:Inturned planar cell polarity effector homolog n=1 Tax=Darwinula stevensoni TaxID=69355 RepID=A0A7R9FPA3_9CRUS|nr:unnamed protein product [Darwinula stevensoni]CAG0897696.1 unnamed protein product [Darwinula stevensoni]